MQANIAFYVHHHGSGHLMRALAISKALQDCNITFMGSGLEPYAGLIPAEISCLHLPKDTADDDDYNYQEPDPVDCLHYAPLNVAGLRKRNKMMTAFFERTYPLLLIVDVSVEVALLARLCGVPSIVVRQHGERNDLPHTMAYQSATALLAPYPPLMQRPEPDWLSAKTIFTGGFSRYAGEHEGDKNEELRTAAIITGAGGTSIDLLFVFHISKKCPDWTFEVLGIDEPSDRDLSDNLNFHGKVREPLEVLLASRVVIGNAGHNTVMEMASLRKRFIVIPEERPFNEQNDKAALLKDSGLATLVSPENLYTVDWPKLLEETSAKDADWPGVIDPAALSSAAQAILSVYQSVFGKDSL